MKRQNCLSNQCLLCIFSKKKKCNVTCVLSNKSLGLYQGGEDSVLDTVYSRESFVFSPVKHNTCAVSHLCNSRTFQNRHLPNRNVGKNMKVVFTLDSVFASANKTELSNIIIGRLQRLLPKLLLRWVICTKYTHGGQREKTDRATLLETTDRYQ